MQLGSWPGACCVSDAPFNDWWPARIPSAADIVAGVSADDVAVAVKVAALRAPLAAQSSQVIGELTTSALYACMHACMHARNQA